MFEFSGAHPVHCGKQATVQLKRNHEPWPEPWPICAYNVFQIKLWPKELWFNYIHLCQSQIKNAKKKGN
jgi:hypothetical protein